MPISIYPPTLLSTLPAFLYTTTSYPINFTLLQITSQSEIGHALIRVVRLTNNRSIINTARYPDGTIYKPADAIKWSNGVGTLSISSSDLAETWLPGYVYKVQMRFGTTPMYSSLGDFATWKQQLINNQTFSEWSTVMILKAIDAPEVTIKNAESVKLDVISTDKVETTLTPLFVGTYSIPAVNKEMEDKFKFDLYEGRDIDNTDPLETSGWLQHNSNSDTSGDNTTVPDEFRFRHVLTNLEVYTVVYTIVTVNGYTSQASPYTFTAARSYYGVLEGVSLVVDDDTEFRRENGCLRLALKSDKPLKGSFVITRSDESSNFQIWDDLHYLLFNDDSFDEDLIIYTDYTIESGIKYRYAILEENAAHLRTQPVYADGIHLVNFEYGYLYHDKVQLKLSLNEKISSFKHTVLGSKQDTLGGRFPHILKNGYAYYAEFPLAGTISFQMDYDQTFFNLRSDGFYYEDELVIPLDKFIGADGYTRYNKARTSDGGTRITDLAHLTIDSNLTDDNIFVERKFREKVEEFLNNYDYKLYKSPTEGNIVVILTNVSMTPNATLGRMIYDFSATAYEVLENTIENLNEYGIIDIGQFETLSAEDTYLVLGLVSGVYTQPTMTVALDGGSESNIYEMIRQQEEVSLGEGYKTSLKAIKAFWIDRYPDTKLTAEITELEAERSERLAEGLPVADLDAEIARLLGIVQAISNNPTGSSILSVNGKEIMVMPNRVYSLREEVDSLLIVRCPYPLVVNYVCELAQEPDIESGIISAIDTSKIWGQISGVFTDTDKTLKTYNYNYGKGEPPFRVYNARPDKTVVYDSLGRVLIDNTTYNVYKSENLYDIIEEETRKQVELIYNIQGGFKQDELGRWTDGVIYYDFSDIIEFDIEADANTILWLGQQADGSDKRKVIIGPTQRYTLNPMEGLIKYIALESEKPQFCLINYKCLTTLMRMMEA